MKPIQLYIADDHPVFAEGLESILSQVQDLGVLGIAKNGKQLLTLMEKQAPDMVLLDISMPEMDGYDTAKAILLRFPKVKIMMLTMHNTEKYLLPFIQLGVHGYVIKNSSKAELLKSIYAVWEKGYYFNQEIAMQVAKAKKEATLPKVSLSERELEVLQLVFKGFSTNQIGEKLFISPRTVETHRKNLLNKTGCSNTAQLIHFALAHHLVKADP